MRIQNRIGPPLAAAPHLRASERAQVVYGFRGIFICRSLAPQTSPLTYFSTTACFRCTPSCITYMCGIWASFPFHVSMHDSSMIHAVPLCVCRFFINLLLGVLHMMLDFALSLSFCWLLCVDHNWTGHIAVHRALCLLGVCSSHLLCPLFFLPYTYTCQCLYNIYL